MLSFLFVLCGVYVGFGILIFFMQSRLVFFPDRKITLTPDDINLKYENITLQTHDAVRINLWFVPAKNAEYTVIFCHGNGGNLSYVLDTVELMHQFGLNVAAFDYRGYGNSEGHPSEQGVYTDAEEVYRFLVETKGIKENEIIVMGRSLGGAVAANLAKNHNPAACIVESAFTSIADMGANQYPFYPVKIICRFKMRTIDYIKQIKSPVLIVHSSEDEIVPFSHGRKIFEAANDPKSFLEIRGSHNEGFSDSIDIYKSGLEKFLKNLR